MRLKTFVFISIILSAAVLTSEPAWAVEKFIYTKVCNGFWQVCLYENGKEFMLTDSKEDKSAPAFSADGEKAAYSTSSGSLWILDLKSKSAGRVTINIPAYDPKFSPDGKTILFMSARDVFHDDTDLWLVDADGKNLRMATKRPWAQADPAWSNSKDEVLYVDSPELYGDEICRINLKTGDIVRLTSNRVNDINPCAVGGSSDVLFSSNENGSYDIYRSDKFGQNRQNLTKGGGFNIMPRSSRSGKTVYFLSDRAGAMQIFSLDTASGKVSQITSDNQDKKDFDAWAD